MSKSRKDDHLKLALDSSLTNNEFSAIRFKHVSIPDYSLNDINLETEILGKVFPLPFYINAMSGGNASGNIMNLKLAALASHFNLPFFLGSQSVALKDAKEEVAYLELRNKYPNLFIVANVNPNVSVEEAKRAIKMVSANALAIHINSVQELVMSEGDRDFSLWSKNIKAILKNISVPVIIKEVGYGMIHETLVKLSNLGAHYIDISGASGTNFTKIELARSGVENSSLLDFGRPTISSLRDALTFDAFSVHASGGINNAGSIVKCLAFGAQAVGMAHYFLKLSELPLEEMIKTVELLITDIKKILLLLNVKSIKELKVEHLEF